MDENQRGSFGEKYSFVLIAPGGDIGSLSPLGFLANFQLSTGLTCLYQSPFEPG